MAVQALAPYYNSEKEYSYRNLNSDAASAKKVREAVDEALDCLSEAQLPDGDFKSWGTENSESCSQVIIALCALGIDLFNDDRFTATRTAALHIRFHTTRKILPPTPKNPTRWRANRRFWLSRR